MILAQDIPSRIAVQGNHLNSFYKNQPCSCFVCSSAGHEAKNCPKKAANKRPAPQDHSNNKAPRTYAEQTAPDSTARPPAGDQAAVPICSTTTDGVPPPPPPPPPARRSTITHLVPEAHDSPSGDSTDHPGTTPFAGADLTTNESNTVASAEVQPEMDVTEQRSGADPPPFESSSTTDSPASAVPVPPRGIASQPELPPSTEPPQSPVLPTVGPPPVSPRSISQLEQLF